MLFRAERIVRFTLPIFVEGLEEEGGDVHLVSPGEQVFIIALLLFLAGAGTEFARAGRPTRLGNDEPAVRQGIPDGLQVGDAIGHGLVNVLALPDRIRVNGYEIQFPGQGCAMMRPPIVVVRNGHRLGNGFLHLSDITDDGIHRHHVIVPVHECFVAHHHGHDGV